MSQTLLHRPDAAIERTREQRALRVDIAIGIGLYIAAVAAAVA